MVAKQLSFRLGRLSAQQFAPVHEIHEGAKAYTEEKTGRRYRAPAPQLHQDPHVGFHIQREYREAQAQPPGPRITKSYEAMRDETNHQYEYMTKPREKGGLGLRHQVTQHDPYQHAHEMAHDVGHNRTIKTLATSTTGSHGFLSDEENDRFRAVHDVFGHAATGRGFSRHGEEAAWRSHVQMFSPKAREAMTSETRGQNSVLNYAPKQGGFVNQAQAMVPMSKLAQSPRASKILKRPPRPTKGTAEQGKLF